MSLVPLSSAGHCCRLTQVDWAGLGAEIMLDCSGKFLNREKLQPYFDRVRCPLPAAAAACTAAGAADCAGTGKCCKAACASHRAAGSALAAARPSTPRCLFCTLPLLLMLPPLQGCKKVVVSAPVKDPNPVLNIVYGVNHVSQACRCCRSHAALPRGMLRCRRFASGQPAIGLRSCQTRRPTHLLASSSPFCLPRLSLPALPCTALQELYNASNDDIVTAASCTTNCLAPVVKVVQEHLGIVHGCITTVHNVTNTQVGVGGAGRAGWGVLEYMGGSRR